MSDASRIEALERELAALKRQLQAAQPGAAQASERGVAIGGANLAPIHTGTQISVTAGQVIGGDFIQVVQQSLAPLEDAAEARSVLTHYLQALADDLSGLQLGEIDGGARQPDQEPLRLSDVYIGLDTQLHIGTETSLRSWLRLRREKSPLARHSAQKLRPVSALEALAEHRELTVLGPAGGGKSTLGASVLLPLAEAWLGQPSALAALGKTWRHGPLLPIRVVLRYFAEQLPAGTAPGRAGDLWAFIARDLRQRGYGLSPDTSHHLQRIARSHGALLLLDGLDECGSGAQRARVLQAVTELKRTAGKHCRFLLTARPYAWPTGPDPVRGVYALAALDDAKVEHFLRAWYAALVRRRWLSAAEAARKQADLLACWRRPDLEPLARNPLLLTLMATLHANRGRLPDDRAELYHESVELLLLRWNRQIGADRALLDALAVPGLKLADLRAALEALAFEVHAASVGSEGTADIGEARLVRAFCPLLNMSKDKADLVVDYIEKRAGLLIGQGERAGERQFAFPHRSFQEFLAACHLAAKLDFPSLCVQLATEAAGHWQVVLPLAARQARAERGASAADALIGSQPVAESSGLPQPAEWRRALLAGLQLCEIGVGALSAQPHTRQILARVRGWLAALLPVHPRDGGLPAVQRAHAAEVLGRLGDPRFDPQRAFLPAEADGGFMQIPADPGFVIGSRPTERAKAVDHEFNTEVTPTPAFYLARYPVTVAQFRVFAEATAFPLGDADALRGLDHAPVLWVNWSEALAYAQWLHHCLLHDAAWAGHPLSRLVREQGWQLTLPSELEWEKAARGGVPNARYPWGDAWDPEAANTDECGIGGPCVVGCFPANPYGLHDLSGNVWEWTRSRYAAYPYRLEEGREDLAEDADHGRVLRGGSWIDGHLVARCAARGGNLPQNRGHGVVGFRLVLRWSSVP